MSVWRILCVKMFLKWVYEYDIIIFFFAFVNLFSLVVIFCRIGRTAIGRTRYSFICSLRTCHRVIFYIHFPRSHSDFQLKFCGNKWEKTCIAFWSKENSHVHSYRVIEIINSGFNAFLDAGFKKFPSSWNFIQCYLLIVSHFEWVPYVDCRVHSAWFASEPQIHLKNNEEGKSQVNCGSDC